MKNDYSGDRKRRYKAFSLLSTNNLLHLLMERVPIFSQKILEIDSIESFYGQMDLSKKIIDLSNRKLTKEDICKIVKVLSERNTRPTNIDLKRRSIPSLDINVVVKTSERDPKPRSFHSSDTDMIAVFKTPERKPYGLFVELPKIRK